ncbi:glutathione S-transferase family protein [Roseibium denhamense]|uniref:Glutathione S-transferase n=2 Tax=Roseibium denhamense TaxID=76305 RepID=A0ABY1P685_9HYPH|nr:glutathione S-transferase family protein [Roseibium denhamense]SMP26553.1 glutathione S-transferase [Roseibium denhamense]
MAASERYRLHGSPDSANLVVRMVLEEIGAPYDYIAVDRLSAEQKSPAYRKLNPQGLIPVLEVPGQAEPMFETGAIILHLADRHERLAPAPAAPDRGAFLKWLFFISNTLHAELRIAFNPGRYLSDGTARADLSTVLIDRATEGFKHLDMAIGKSGGPFLLGADISVIDIYAAACARWAQIYGLLGVWRPVPQSGFCNMLHLLESRPAIGRACTKEQIPGLPFTAAEGLSVPGVTG